MLSEIELDNWLDVAGLMPPLPSDVSTQMFSKTGGSTSGLHTFIPNLMTRETFYNDVLPTLEKTQPPEMVSFIKTRVEKTFEIRNTLKKLQPEIEAIVGTGNFSALWIDREAFSTDSMEHRALITEAVIHVYTPEALQNLVTLLYQHKVPMIPYGEGGGYGMGVTPMAPAVTISPRGMDAISEIRESRATPGRFEITVGAGVPFKDLQLYLSKRGYVLRCDPNTPRAATGGIAATGSNGGRKAFEVILHGRAVTAQGTAVCFAPDAFETSCIDNEPFLLARKFFSIEDTEKFKSTFTDIKARNLRACTRPAAISVPLQGMKAEANMMAQRSQQTAHTVDTMLNAPTLPISAFVGAEGCTGFIFEVTFEIERPLPYLKSGRWHFTSTEAAIAATRAIKSQKTVAQPVFFELITGASIRTYLLNDFPTVFSNEDEAVLIIANEGATAEACEQNNKTLFTLATNALSAKNLLNHLRAFSETQVMDSRKDTSEFELMRKPREELPKKLRTKCKTDMEIRTEYLADVLKIVAAEHPLKYAERTRDVLFGHLTPNHTAIIHWNIGGFDLYDEEQADVAWEYLERVISKAQNLAPADDLKGSAKFTGEHGVAGKAAFLWLNQIPEADFKRMCVVKDTLDPEHLFNPDTIFLRSTLARSLRARLLNVAQKHLTPSTSAEDFALAEALRCTRCTSCKICPVIDAEHEIKREEQEQRKRSAFRKFKTNLTSDVSVLPSKRSILMFMERIAVMRKGAAAHNDPELVERVKKATNAMFVEGVDLLKKCFYCRRCDKACPVDINIHPVVRAYHQMAGIPERTSALWKFIYERMMGEDFFKPLTYRLVAFFILLGQPFLALARHLKFIPDWLKSYTTPPQFSLTHYEAANHGLRLQPADNFVVIGADHKLPQTEPHVEHVYIRYRGCMDTFGRKQATTSVDSYFKDVLGVRFVDLEKKMCCGFPFEADGLHERAKQSQMISVIEIIKCVVRVVAEAGANASPLALKFSVFSNCPTCCEAIREMKGLLHNPETGSVVRARAKMPADFDMRYLEFGVIDTAEIAVNLLKHDKSLRQKTIPLVPQKIEMKVGLKVPCHNTKTATAAQLQLLGMYYTGVSAYDNCCGLSGSNRLKHPKIGTKIAEKLFDQIREQPAELIVSGCPSCRDGVRMQQSIVAAKQDAVADFKVAGLFEGIADYHAKRTDHIA